jgi:hypothetical protein
MAISAGIDALFRLRLKEKRWTVLAFGLQFSIA